MSYKFIISLADPRSGRAPNPTTHFREHFTHTVCWLAVTISEDQYKVGISSMSHSMIPRSNTDQIIEMKIIETENV